MATRTALNLITIVLAIAGLARADTASRRGRTS